MDPKADFEAKVKQSTSPKEKYNGEDKDKIIETKVMNQKFSDLQSVEESKGNATNGIGDVIHKTLLRKESARLKNKEINKKNNLFSHQTKHQKMNPLRGSRAGSTNQLFAPKIASGTPGHPRRRKSASGGSPGPFFIDFFPDFMIFHRFCSNYSSNFCCFFLY